MAAASDKDFASYATELLLRIASDPQPKDVRAYDTLLFRPLYNMVRHRGASLAADAAQALASPGIHVPPVAPADLDAVAIDVTVAALERARRTADRFDPARGDGATWAIGAAKFAYIDVVREFYQSRRRAHVVPVDPADLPELSAARQAAASPEQVAETRAALLDALGRLDEDERTAILAREQGGMSYTEIASYMFGDPTLTKRVDRLLQSARVKLRAAERVWNGTEE